MLANLVSWCRARGWDIDAETSLECVDAPEAGGGRAVRARRDIAAGEVLAAVPPACLVSTAHLDADFLPGAPPTARLCAALALARHDEDAAWHVYASTLPTAYATPVDFTELEMEALADFPHTRLAFEQGRAEARRAYATIAAAVPWNDFAWAWAAFSSRTCYMQVDRAAGDVSVLVPFVDMLNHSPAVATEAAWDDAARRYVVRTLTPFRAGEEVCIQYGAHDNDKLAYFYGFVMDDNEMQWVHVDPEIAGRPPSARHDAWISQYALRAADFVLDRDGCPSWNLATYLAVIAASDTDLDDPDKQDQLAGFEEGDTRAARRAVARIARTMLKKFATSADEDQLLLDTDAEDGSLSPCMRLAVRMRMLKKRILERARDASGARPGL